VARGHQAGTEFLTGYVIEYSLSVDNIFVFVLIFSAFGTKEEHQYRVLFWGIIGALLMRGILIAVGATLIATFHWITYLFGAFLVLTGARMAMHPPHSIDPDANPVLRLVRRLIPISTQESGQRFFLRAPDSQGVVRRMATPLFVVLILIETMDLVFAVDSIPAVFSVTRDAFIVYTSNVCAILGLRSLYFLLAAVIQRFHLLHYGLALVLAFVGAKMLASGTYEISTIVSLTVISLILAGSIILSLAFPPRRLGVP
jgi:tellurite resistance protein TerC